MSGHRRGYNPLVTGSFRGVRMGGGAFNLLKMVHNGPESAKQLKISLAGLLKLLSIFLGRTVVSL
jgi:hypothetical protein